MLNKKQNGPITAFTNWTRTEVETMHKEAPEAVWAWNGIPHWKRCETSNAQVTGSPASSALERGVRRRSC